MRTALREAMQTIKDECRKYDDCYDCPLHRITCVFPYPKEPWTWEIPTEKAEDPLAYTE